MSASVSVAQIDEESLELDIPTQMPSPTGFRMLLAPLVVAEKTEGGIILPDQRRDDESAASIVACIVKMGPDCYSDTKRFPNGPWAKVGDWVIIPSYSGTHIKVKGMDFRIVNDDTIHAVVDDPRGVARA
jgi:co-chaperonin GroES (HSP10)